MNDDNPCPDCWQLAQEKQELRDKLTALRIENGLRRDAIAAHARGDRDAESAALDALRSFVVD